MWQSNLIRFLVCFLYTLKNHWSKNSWFGLVFFFFIGKQKKKKKNLVLRWSAWIIVWRWAFIFRCWRRNRWILISWRSTIPMSIWNWSKKKKYKCIWNIFWEKNVGFTIFKTFKFNKSLITLEPCHCILPHVIHYRHDVHDVVNQNPHSNQHGGLVMTYDDHFFVAYSSGHCLNNWKWNEIQIKFMSNGSYCRQMAHNF